MANEDITVDTVPEGVDVAPAEGGEAVGGETKEQTPPSDSISLDEIKEVLGKDFPSKEAALKSVKDTYNHVGQKQETANKEAARNLDGDVKDLLENQAKSIAELTKDNFYAKNPQFEAVKDLIEDSGKDRSEFVKSDAFKQVFEKVQGFDKTQEAENVLKSNPRITETRDSMKQSREALAEGNFKGAENKAIDAVLESLGQ